MVAWIEVRENFHGKWTKIVHSGAKIWEKICMLNISSTSDLIFDYPWESFFYISVHRGVLQASNVEYLPA